MIQVGEFTISECSHSGIWISRYDGEGMQITHETLAKFEQLLAAFWAEHF